MPRPDSVSDCPSTRTRSHVGSNGGGENPFAAKLTAPFLRPYGKRSRSGSASPKPDEHLLQLSPATAVYAATEPSDDWVSVHDHERACNELKRKLEDADAFREYAEKSAESTRAALEDARAELESAKADSARKEGQVAELNSLVASISTKLSSQQELRAAAEAQVAQVRTETAARIAKSTETEEAALSKLADLTKAANEFKARAEAAENTRAAFSARYHRDMAAKEEQLTKLIQAVAASESKVDIVKALKEHEAATARIVADVSKAGHEAVCKEKEARLADVVAGYKQIIALKDQVIAALSHQAVALPPPHLPAAGGEGGAAPGAAAPADVKVRE